MDNYGTVEIELGVNLYFRTDSNIGTELDDLILTVQKDVIGMTRDIALEIMDIAQRWCPVDTGFLKSTGRLVEGTNSWEIVYDADYAKYVENKVGWLKSAFDYVMTKHRNSDIIASYDDSTGSIIYNV